MQLDMSALSSGQAYHAMIQSLIPRPIAWVLSDNGNGSYNLAPFSYFMGVCGNPPTVAFSVGYKSDGSPKDTRANIEARKKFVVHIARMNQAADVTDSSRALPHGESELDYISQKTVAFGDFPVPRLEACPIAMGCELDVVHEIGHGKQGVIFGRILHMYVEDAVASEDDRGRLKIDPKALDPLARLGGNDYGSLGSTLTIERPK